MTEAMKLPAGLGDFASPYNQLVFTIKQLISSSVSTAIPVRVDTVERNGDGSGGGYLSATPLVAQTDAEGNLIAPVSIPRLPYFRLQHGTAAIICDPAPGDVGLAVFAQSDCSRLSGGTEPVTPGSFRSFDMSDGFYIGGFWGKTPETFIHIEQAGTVHVVAKTVTTDCDTCVTNCKQATVNADSHTDVTTPEMKVTGMLTVTGLITGSGGLAISGGSGATVDGSLKTTGDVVAAGISLDGHTHSGVQPGSGSTGGPQ